MFLKDGKEESCKFTFARLWSKTKILRFWITSNAKAKLIAMAAKLSGMPAFLTDKNNPVGYCVQGAIEFGMDSRRLIQRCTKPDAKEFKKIAVACAIGFSINGLHWLHCEAGLHPNQQHHCGWQLSAPRNQNNDLKWQLRDFSPC